MEVKIQDYNLIFPVSKFVIKKILPPRLIWGWGVGVGGRIYKIYMENKKIHFRALF